MQGTIQIKKGKIVEINESSGFVEIINDEGSHRFQNAHAYPGFVDSHGHIYALGNLMTGIRLFNADSPEECISIIKAHKETSSWIVGMGWNQERFSPASYPTKVILDRHFPDIPVYLRRADGHSAWVNSKAIEIAGISNDTPDPTGGKILRDDKGNATGILIDNAMNLVSAHIPKRSDRTKKESIIHACHELASKGLTEVHDMDVNPDLIPLFHELNTEGKLPIRIQSYLQAQNDEYISKCNSPYNSNFLNVIGLKFYADGALGSHGSALLDPYKDLPDSKGLTLISEEILFEKALKGMTSGFDIATHAIGDAACRMVVNTYSKLREYSNVNRILRLEHTQIISDIDIERMEQYHIIPSIQPIHCIGDIEMAEKRLSNKTLNRSYLWQSLLNKGLDFASGSDFPIESHDPLTGINALVNRIKQSTKQPWRPEEIVSRDHAIQSYCETPHKIVGVSSRGRIEIGFDADLSIFSEDLRTSNEIEQVRPISTFVHGKSIFQI